MRHQNNSMTSYLNLKDRKSMGVLLLRLRDFGLLQCHLLNHMRNWTKKHCRWWREKIILNWLRRIKIWGQCLSDSALIWNHYQANWMTSHQKSKKFRIKFLKSRLSPQLNNERLSVFHKLLDTMTKKQDRLLYNLQKNNYSQPIQNPLK